MKSRSTRGYSPNGESLESRLPTAAVPSLRQVMAERIAERAANRALRSNNPALRPPLARTPGVTIPGPNGPTTTIGAGFLGNQIPKFNHPAPPTYNVNFGVIGIKNTTEATVTLSISASTFEYGKFYDFTFKPGEYRVFYAPYGGPFNSAPTFQVSFDTAERRDVIQLAEVESVLANGRWSPMLTTAAAKYQITSQFGSLTVLPA